MRAGPAAGRRVATFAVVPFEPPLFAAGPLGVGPTPEQLELREATRPKLTAALEAEEKVCPIGASALPQPRLGTTGEEPSRSSARRARASLIAIQRELPAPAPRSSPRARLSAATCMLVNGPTAASARTMASAPSASPAATQADSTAVLTSGVGAPPRARYFSRAILAPLASPISASALMTRCARSASASPNAMNWRSAQPTSPTERALSINDRRRPSRGIELRASCVSHTSACPRSNFCTYASMTSRRLSWLGTRPSLYICDSHSAAFGAELALAKLRITAS
mmetsp:Transcript_69435/g.151134  ORF Transcript_69435/g.151134 Transcript_69435/m.151134 type:complete len:283 (+) Transcript_69435:139-987(+)